MVTISCSGKFHAFNLAEQLEKHEQLSALYTTYAWSKNTLMRRFAGREDKENVPVEKIHTAVPLAVMMKLRPQTPHVWNEFYDKWVAKQLTHRQKSKVFIGWTGMSLHSLRRAKAMGMKTIVERGSAHIQLQDQILQEEYRQFGIEFRIDPRTVEKELREYEEADYISIPSTFAKKSFIDYGFPERKLVVNPYGFSGYFKRVETDFPNDVFRVLYLGSSTIQKGMVYLFEALQKLNIPAEKLEAWFVGKVDDEIKPTVERYARPNWKFFGHVNHYDLPKYISACDVAVQPSLQDGFGMVILQVMSCGVPVIASTNTGGPDAITEGKDGYIVPIRDPEAIASRIQALYDDPALLKSMKVTAAGIGKREWTWADYGNRYSKFIKSLY
jgi:glycosyltransferase involved in cell wall biosynthesis